MKQPVGIFRIFFFMLLIRFIAYEREFLSIHQSERKSKLLCLRGTNIKKLYLISEYFSRLPICYRVEENALSDHFIKFFLNCQLCDRQNRLLQLFVTVNIEISHILSFFHLGCNHADQPDQTQQVVGMLMAHENFVNSFHRDIGFFQLRHNSVSTAGIHQKIFLASFNGKTSIKTSGYGCITGTQ